MQAVTRQQLSGIRHSCKQVDFQVCFESFNSFSMAVPTVGRYTIAGGSNCMLEGLFSKTSAGVQLK